MKVIWKVCVSIGNFDFDENCACNGESFFFNLRSTFYSQFFNTISFENFFFTNRVICDSRF